MDDKFAAALSARDAAVAEAADLRRRLEEEVQAVKLAAAAADRERRRQLAGACGTVFWAELAKKEAIEALAQTSQQLTQANQQREGVQRMLEEAERDLAAKGVELAAKCVDLGAAESARDSAIADAADLRRRLFAEEEAGRSAAEELCAERADHADLVLRAAADRQALESARRGLTSSKETVRGLTGDLEKAQSELELEKVSAGAEIGRLNKQLDAEREVSRELREQLAKVEAEAAALREAASQTDLQSEVSLHTAHYMLMGSASASLWIWSSKCCAIGLIE